MSCKLLKYILQPIFLQFLFNCGIEAQYFDDDPGTHYSYFSNDLYGPKNWGGICNMGVRQSPIRYDSPSDVITMPSSASKLTLMGGKSVQPSDIRVVNNGYGVFFEFIYSSPTLVPKITLGPLGNKHYKFHSFSYHVYGEHQATGNINACDLEFQFLHYKADYKSLQEAKDKPDGLAVISVCHNILPTSSPKIFIPNLMFALATATNSPSDGTLNGITQTFSYTQALGFTQMPSHYYYTGSQTFPPCTENVKWFIVKEVFRISKTAFDKFYKINVFASSPLSFNARPIQKLGTRKVYLYN